MRRMSALLLALVLASGVGAPPVGAAPAAAAPTPYSGPLPPESAVVRPAVDEGVQAPGALKRLGTLRIPDLGIREPVYYWGCRDATVPDKVLQWGCTTTRNRFLAGHAYGVFKPYLRAYKEGRLKRGMIARWITPSGNVIRYRLAWVRKVPKTYIWNGLTGEQWAWNATSAPALTLQTCMGATNQYRIVSRWERV